MVNKQNLEAIVIDNQPFGVHITRGNVLWSVTLYSADGFTFNLNEREFDPTNPERYPNRSSMADAGEFFPYVNPTGSESKPSDENSSQSQSVSVDGLVIRDAALNRLRSLRYFDPSSHDETYCTVREWYHSNQESIPRIPLQTIGKIAELELITQSQNLFHVAPNKLLDVLKPILRFEDRNPSHTRLDFWYKITTNYIRNGEIPDLGKIVEFVRRWNDYIHGPKTQQKFLQILDFNLNWAPKLLLVPKRNSLDEVLRCTLLEVEGANNLLFLGSGAVGDTFLIQSKLDRQFLALKVFKSGYEIEHQYNGASVNYVTIKKSREEGYLSLAVHEIRQSIGITGVVHQNLVRPLSCVKAAFDGSERYALVFEYIDGISLKNDLPKNGYDNNELYNLFIQLVEGIEHLHLRARMRHSDIKPENCMIESSTGTVKLIDFGTASYLRENINVRGDRSYQPIEVFDGCADFRSDLYSLGVMLYELDTGTHIIKDEIEALHDKSHIVDLLRDPKMYEVMHQRIDTNASPGLRPTLHGLLQRDPGDRRFQTITQLKEEVQSPEYKIGLIGPIRED